MTIASSSGGTRGVTWDGSTTCGSRTRASAAAVERLAARLLGREVAELAEDDPGRRLLELQRRAREAEVRELHLARVRQQHVRGRDVAVDELEPAERVRVPEPARELLDDVDGDVDGEGHALLRAAVPDGQ